MAFGVFIHRVDSPYDDSPAERYQFPRQYLSRVSETIGDWIVYYEPTKVRDSKGYNAIARVAQVVPDPTKADMFVALIEPGSYLDFVSPVPFMVEDGVAERGLLNEQGRISGRAQAAVRPISASDFARILLRGLADEEPVLPRLDRSPSVSELDEGPQTPFIFAQDRMRIDAVVSRVVRDRVFRRLVLKAYDERCAITGLKLINGGGRAEVAAAHIRPVESNGPDIINNGLALSGTAHWMLDRGLIGLSDDLEIMVSRHVNDRDSVESLINRTGQLIGPLAQRDRPHPTFLAWHRQNVFKQ